MENNFEPQAKETQEHHVNKATLVSKHLALALFAALPFISFLAGYNLAPEKVVEVEKIVETEKIVEIEKIVEVAAVTKPDQALDKPTTVADLKKLSSNDFKAKAQYETNVIQETNLDCLPASSEVVTTNDIKEIQELVPDQKYGDFLYKGYKCVSTAPGKLTPILYFSGPVEVSGNDIFTELGGTEYFKISEKDESKFPKFTYDEYLGYTKLNYVSAFDPKNNLPDDAKYPDWPNNYGPTTTLTISEFVYGGVNKGYQSYYGGITPSVTAAKILESD